MLTEKTIPHLFPSDLKVIMAPSVYKKGASKNSRKADPSTVKDKFLVGYRGCFIGPKDVDKPMDHHGWFDGSIEAGLRPNVDILPDVSAYERSELHEAPGLVTKGGEQCYVFSSRNQKTVDRHFKWMGDHRIDGVFFQKSLKEENEGIRRIRDEVGLRVQKAAENTGRVFAIMYDVSGFQLEDMKEDKEAIVLDDLVFKSPRYLKEKGMPVVALSGFNFEDHTPDFIRSVAFRVKTAYKGGVYLIARVPANWRTPTGDADQNEMFVDVCLNSFNSISPWSVGSYNSIERADKFAKETISADVELIDRHNKDNKRVFPKGDVGYIPVVFPGWSGHNSSDGKRFWDFGRDPREGGKFLWRQIINAKKRGARTIYAATWDGYDDGTAILPVVNNQEKLPVPFVATHQEELALPVIITHQSQLPVHVTVSPGGGQGMPLHVLVTPDRHQPSLPGVIGTTQDVFGDGERYHINTVVLTPQDRSPLPDSDWQDKGPVIVARQGQLPPRAFVPYPAQDLTVYITERDKLSLPVHIRYRFLAPDESDVLPSDWYMRICGLAAETLHGNRRFSEAFPSGELERYQTAKPKGLFSWAAGLFAVFMSCVQPE